MTTTTNSWTVINTGTTDDGHDIEMRFAEFGKGRAKVRYWRIYRDGWQAGYASTERDAAANFQRVLSGLVRNDQTGRYEPAGSFCPDRCPACGADLAEDGYPIGHQHASTGEQCVFTWDA